MNDVGGVVGAGGPVLDGDPLTFGLVSTWNQSDEPVELVEARLLRLDPDLELLGFSARPFGAVPITAREHPVPRSMPLAEFPPQPPTDEDQFAVLFGLKVRPGGGGGAALGVEVIYRQGRKLRRQQFRTIATICSAPTLKSDCADEMAEGLGDYDDEVKKRVKART